MSTNNYSIVEVNLKFKEVLQNSDIGFKEGYLFGSRARGDCRKDSDWDYLIIIDKDIPGKAIRALTGRLYSAFHKIVPDEPADIIVKTESIFEKSKNTINHISNEVYTYGIRI